MQGGFIKGLKKIYRSVKHEFQGADIHGYDDLLLKSEINHFKLDKSLQLNINSANFTYELTILDKDVKVRKYSVKELKWEKKRVDVFNKKIEKFQLGVKNSMEVIIPYRLVYEFLDIKSITKVREFNFNWDILALDIVIPYEFNKKIKAKGLDIDWPKVFEKKREEFSIPTV